MEIAVENFDDDILRVALRGRLDIAGTDAISIKLARLITTLDNMKVILNLSDVDFIASAGIGTIATVAKEVQRRNGKLVLLNPKPIVDTVLRIINIEKVVPVYYELNEAQAALLDYSTSSEPHV